MLRIDSMMLGDAIMLSFTIRSFWKYPGAKHVDELPSALAQILLFHLCYES